ncbi:MAG TPA: PilZ domain-containing protein [Candidatus Angelobacter sp.]|jgi:hypothetical protein|nr:PilZ domain-containing protein [Candidatus Angelobacter sp.]
MLNSARIERKYIRYGCDQRLCVRYRVEGHDFAVYGRCKVVGKGGLGSLLPAAELEIGQVVSVEIAIANPAPPSTLKAQVKNRHGSNYGFQFLESDSRTAIVLSPLFRPEAVQVFQTPSH